MKTKLHAMTYIRNNKKRAAILIICLSLFIGAQYGASYFIHSNVSVSYAAGVDIFKNAALVNVEPAALGLDESLYNGNTDRYSDTMLEEYEKRVYSLAEEFETDDRIIRAYPCTICTSRLNLVLGNWGFGGPLLKKDEIADYLEDMDAELVEGRLPENPGELLFDSKLAKNMDCKIGDDISGVFKLCGIVDCDIYMLTGLASDSIKGSMLTNAIWLITDGTVTDAGKLVTELGYTEDEIPVNQDYDSEMKVMKEEMISSYETSTSIITIVLAFILCFCVLIVFILHIRDRHEEWCLYQSIGFSSKNIYLMAFKELVICFMAALVCGIAFAAVILTAGELVIMIPEGLCAEIFLPKQMIQIGCLLLFIFGLLQLPVIHAISKTKTVDAIEDDI